VGAHPFGAQKSEREWSLPAVLDVVTSAVPERDMLVWESERRSFAEVRARTCGFGAFLAGRGVGAGSDPDHAQRWECGQDKVAIVLSNCPTYIEATIGAFRARAVPFNVNHHYNPREVAALLAQIGADCVVYHRRLAPLLSEADLGARVLVHVDDGSDGPVLPGSVAFEVAVRSDPGGDLPTPSPDDRYLVCTGGTTGRPKGVLWRQGDVYVSAMGGRESATREDIASGALRGPGVWYPAPPLMHAAGLWTALIGLNSGATVVLHDDAGPFDPSVILATAERERVTLMSIVGDAYAGPIVSELRRRTYDLSALQIIGIGGAFTSPALKHALLELLPHAIVNDGYGSSETGGMAFGASRLGDETRRFIPSPGACVLSADKTHFLEPGDEEVGWMARRGRVPLAYLDDREATERTFPIIDGARVSVPGDRATYESDGTVTVLGRDAMVVNTGGEKVFVEEVETAILGHPRVVDVLVVGRPNERFGEEVVALVQIQEGATMTPQEVREFAALHLARFKAPRAVLICDRVGRHSTGKPDYKWAREAAAEAVAAT
jgi:3-oxocholest-4-en-26-oate---CoA ligase